MAKYLTFKYGTGYLYGYSATIDYVYPDTGPSTGGTDFVISGEYLKPVLWDDTFTVAPLDPTKWVDISFGGSVTPGATHLYLDTSATPNSMAGIISLATWNSLQFEARVILPTITSYPATSFVVFNMTYWVDGSNYTVFQITLDSYGELLLSCVTTIAGTVVDTYSVEWSYGLSVLKLLRHGTMLEFIANGTVIHTFNSFSILPVYMVLYSLNDPVSTLACSCYVESILFKPFVVFADQIVHDVVAVSDYRLRGKTCASMSERHVSAAYAGPVDVTVVGFSDVTVADAFTYYFEDSLRVVNSEQTSTLLSFIDDTQLKTKDGVKKGIGA